MTPQEIKTLRAKLGISQTELGRRIGLKLRQVQNIEAGSSKPSGSVLMLLKQIKERAMDEIVRETIKAKKEAGSDSYLWLHDSGDCILWPSEEKSIDDDGQNAIERWQLDDESADALRESGEVNGW